MGTMTMTDDAAAAGDDGASDVGPNYIPIFEATPQDMRSLRYCAHLKIIKTDGEGPLGVVGEIPKDSTEKTICNLFGNGTYTVKAINGKGIVIATRNDLGIAMRKANPAAEAEGSAILALASSVGVAATDQANTHVAGVQSFYQAQHATAVASLEAQRERDERSAVSRENMMAQFFSGVLQQSQQAHDHSMQEQRASAAHTLQVMSVMMKTNENPGEMMMAYLKMGHEMGQGSDADPLVLMMREGRQITTELADIARLKYGDGTAKPRPRLGSGNGNGSGEQSNGGASSASSSNGKSNGAANSGNREPKNQLGIDKSNLKHIAVLKKACEDAGEDFDAICVEMFQWVTRPEESEALAEKEAAGDDAQEGAETTAKNAAGDDAQEGAGTTA